MSLPDFATVSAGAFTGITGTNGPSAADLSSLRASFFSEFSQTADQPTTTSHTADSSSAKTATPTPTSNESSTVPTTLATSILPSQDISPANGSESPTGTAANAASSTGGNNPTVTKQDSCNGVSCNSGLQAAIAVPVVLGILAILALLFFLLRRRRRRQQAEPISEKTQPTPKKKWSRHLRVFSFDAELLMGGWRSSSNSIRSRQTGSVRSGQTSDHGRDPSIHSVDEVAPPYRDAVTTAQRPPGARGITSPSPDPFPRPSSTATAPPPYGTVAGNTSRQSNRPTTVARDPFADASPISPVEGSPFNDPPEGEPMMSRQSSLLRSINEDGNSTLAGSDAGSIREAQIGRNLSVMSGGRTIENGRKASSS
jgi:hypothetical protein